MFKKVLNSMVEQDFSSNEPRVLLSQHKEIYDNHLLCYYMINVISCSKTRFSKSADPKVKFLKVGN